MDRGPEFGSVAFDPLCAACSIDKLERPPGRPKFGSTVERLFSTVNTQLVHVLSGNTQLLKNPGAMSRDVDPRPDALWRLTQLDALVRRLLFEVCPRQPHKGLDGMTPHARFEHGLVTVASGRPFPTRRTSVSSSGSIAAWRCDGRLPHRDRGRLLRRPSCRRLQRQALGPVPCRARR